MNPEPSSPIPHADTIGNGPTAGEPVGSQMNAQLMGYLKGGFENKYPRQLEARFGRVFEKIITLWNTPALEGYFSELLIADRAGRQGFPPDVATEIFFLSNAYDEIQRRPKGEDDAWFMERSKALDQLQELGLRFTANDMMKAVESGDPARVVVFLNAGMSVDVRDSREWTPMMVAAFNGREAVARLFIKHGANIHAQDRGGYTPLHWAALNGYDEVVKLLLEKSALVNALSNYGLTPLLQAAARGHAGVVTRLLNARADATLATNDGATPLHKAVANQHMDTVMLLLKRGVSVHAQDKDGTTPMSIAEKARSTDIIQIMLAS